MTFHLEGVHICHIVKNGFKDCIVIHFQPKNDSHVVWDQFNKEDPRALPFVLLIVSQ